MQASIRAKTLPLSSVRHPIRSRLVLHQRPSRHHAVFCYSQATHPDEPVAESVMQKLNEWSDYMLTPYVRPPIILARGKGCKVWDSTGREFLDFTAGIAVNALGHADEQVAQVMYKAALELVHCSNVFHNHNAGELAKSLIESTKSLGGLGFSANSLYRHSKGGGKVFFANSGAEANEGALKFARKFGKIKDPSGQKHGLVCFTNAFHGRTLGALSVTYQPKYQLPFQPLIPGVTAGELNNVEALQTLVTRDTCGVILEPIQGEGGVLEAQEEFLRALRQQCNKVNAILIFDEIQCGLGRTGNLWAHGSFPVDCHPDIVTMAKPLANGVPIGAIMMRDKVASAIEIGDHGTTFGGGPLQTAVAHHVLNRICNREFLSQVVEVGKLLKLGLETRIVNRFPRLVVGPVRGKGLILGMDVIKKEDTAGLDVVQELIRRARERGLLLLSCGKNTIRFVPSLVVTTKEVELALSILESVLVALEQEIPSL